MTSLISTRSLIAALGAAFILGPALGSAQESKADRPFVFNLGVEPKTIDPGKSTTIDASIVLRNVFEGLTRPMPDGSVEPAAAESWTVSDDGLEYTFTLHEDGRWSNGDTVKAADFEYSMLRVLEPEFAAEYAYSLFMIAGAEAYNTGKGPREDVGIEAVDDRTLRLRVAAPTPYLLSFLDHSTFLPVHPSTAKANENWALKAETFISNGPYRLTAIVPKERIELEVNAHHRDAAKIGLRRISFREIVDASTALIEFRNGRIHGITSNPPIADIPALRDEGILKNVANLGTYFVCFNTKQPPFDNPKVREAFTLAIDRQRLVRLLRTGEEVALAFVPPGIAGPNGRDFRAEHGDFFADGDTKAAQKALEEAGYPGGKGLPPITYIYNTLDRHKQVAEYLQGQWRRALGVRVRLQNMEWKVLNDARKKGNFQIARHGWIGDYRDPQTFLDMWISESGNNDAQWSNAEYDRLIAKARGEADAAARLATFAEAERLLFGDFAICPLFYYTQNYYETDEVEGIERSVTMTIRFDRARWK